MLMALISYGWALASDDSDCPREKHSEDIWSFVSSNTYLSFNVGNISSPQGLCVEQCVCVSITCTGSPVHKARGQMAVITCHDFHS